MSTCTCTIRLEGPDDDAAICAIHAEAFGPGRFTRTAFRVREGIPHDADLSFVAFDDGAIVGSVRLTPIRIGVAPAQLLGPLAVLPAYKNKGYGKQLMRMALEAARQKGERLVLLVGDPPYYGPLGFHPVPLGRIDFPGPVDPARILLAELSDGAALEAAGKVARRA